MSAASRGKRALKKQRLVFLFDVDNTLLDNDRVIQDLQEHLRREVGARKCARYWHIFEHRRAEVGYADYLGALQIYRAEYPHDMNLLAVSRYLIDYPFANRLFANSLDVLRQAQRRGCVALLTDGDVVFQPHKVERSGLHDVVGGKVLIYVHKEKELADVQAHYPADHYFVVDDKLRILTAIKQCWGTRVTTVFVRQGHYAMDPQILASCPPADLSVRQIGELLNFDLKTLLAPAAR